MRQLVEMAGRHDLEWTETGGLTKAYELRAGCQVVAALTFRGLSNPFARGISGDGRWIFERTGYFPAKATVRAVGSNAHVAMFVDDRIEFADGRQFRARSGFWGARIELTGNDGAPIVRLRQCRFRRPTQVEVLQAGASLPELPVLVLLAWYVLVVWLWSDD